MIKESIHNGCYCGACWKQEVDFHKNGNIVHFRDALAVTGIITNIARTTKESTDSQINQLIKKPNGSYNKIKHITEEDMTG